jgi:hypothetical protein
MVSKNIFCKNATAWALENKNKLFYWKGNAGSDRLRINFNGCGITGTDGSMNRSIADSGCGRKLTYNVKTVTDAYGSNADRDKKKNLHHVLS